MAHSSAEETKLEPQRLNTMPKVTEEELKHRQVYQTLKAVFLTTVPGRYKTKEIRSLVRQKPKIKTSKKVI